jgi:hypothetical protein
MTALPEYTVSGVPAGGRRDAAGANVRVLFIGMSAFAWLKSMQERTSPRLDMRYLIEGVLMTLQERPDLRGEWTDVAAEVNFAHLAARRAASQTQMVGALRAQRHDGEEVSGTSGNLVAVQGAKARTSEAPAQAQQQAQAQASHKPAHHDDCKALQISDGGFQWLKGVQGTTRDPRLEIRFLMEGAFVLVQGSPMLLPKVIGHARQALAAHLAQLQNQPIQL